jgi:hypothetical protein
MHANSNAALELHHSLLSDLRASGWLDESMAGVVPLVEAFKTIDVPDAPTRTVVVGPSGERLGVLFVSTPVEKSYVAQNIQRAEQARQVLGDDLGSVILRPLAHGDFRGLSFAIWPWHRPMISARGLAYLQKRYLSGKVLSWLCKLTEATVQELDPGQVASTFIEPLALMERDAELDAKAREIARRALARLDAGAWRPRVVLEHKEVGGNILLPTGRDRRSLFPWGFIVVDWAGTNFSGYPFTNLLAFARTFRVGFGRLRADLMRHCRIVSCDPGDIVPNVLAALGFLRARLGNFPETNYRIIRRNILEHALTAVEGMGRAVR